MTDEQFADMTDEILPDLKRCYNKIREGNELIRSGHSIPDCWLSSLADSYMFRVSEIYKKLENIKKECKL